MHDELELFREKWKRAGAVPYFLVATFLRVPLDECRTDEDKTNGESEPGSDFGVWKSPQLVL